MTGLVANPRVAGLGRRSPIAAAACCSSSRRRCCPTSGSNLLAKFCCLAMVAVGIGLAWGRGGMLMLGQGVFFGLGGYLMAMHLKLSDAGPGGVPDFMLLYGDGTVPGWWEPFRRPGRHDRWRSWSCPRSSPPCSGLAVFKRRVRGAYFAILSQALAAAFAILLVGQQKVTGGTNGLNGFQSFFGFTSTTR